MGTPAADPGVTLASMYDVVYIDSEGCEIQLASSFEDRRSAAELARHEALERGAGRMVLPGSSKALNCVCVIPQTSAVVSR